MFIVFNTTIVHLFFVFCFVLFLKKPNMASTSMLFKKSNFHSQFVILYLEGKGTSFQGENINTFPTLPKED